MFDFVLCVTCTLCARFIQHRFTYTTLHKATRPASYKAATEGMTETKPTTNAGGRGLRRSGRVGGRGYEGQGRGRGIRDEDGRTGAGPQAERTGAGASFIALDAVWHWVYTEEFSRTILLFYTGCCIVTITSDMCTSLPLVFQHGLRLNTSTSLYLFIYEPPIPLSVEFCGQLAAPAMLLLGTGVIDRQPCMMCDTSRCDAAG
jgi:hypothetical protein